MAQQRSENTREQVMAAAVELFCRLGYDACGVAQICETAGISKGAFYHHFPSKKALFLAIMDRWLQSIDERIAGFRTPGSSVPRVMQAMTGAMESIFTDASGQLPMFMEFMVQASRDQAVWEATIAPYRIYQTQFARMLAEGKDEGSIRVDLDEQAAAWVLIAFLVGTLLQGEVMPEAADWKLVVKTGMRMFLDSVQRSAE
jgi:AcrR family transcriptional regulator